MFMLGAQKFSGSLVFLRLAFARASFEIAVPTSDQSVELNEAASPTTWGKDVGALSHSQAHPPHSGLYGPQAAQSRIP